MADVMIPVSPGELADKLTILRLKDEMIDDPVKLANVRHELAVLEAVADDVFPVTADLKALWDALYEINRQLWQIEDDIRACEAQKDFGETFIALARAVYVTNDKRADVKKRMNLLLGSAIVEEKSYYSTDPK